MRPLDRSNIQSLVLQSHLCAHSRHFLFRCTDKACAKRFLAEWLPRVSRGNVDEGDQTGAFVHIAVSWPGLDKVGAFDNLGGVGEAAKAFFFDFKDPPDQVSLAAYGPSSPENWWNKRFKSRDIDLSVHIYCAREDMLTETTDKVRASARANLLEELVPTIDGEAITGKVLGAEEKGLRKLHFGYCDGFSQPQINWDDDPAQGQGPPLNGKGVYPRRYFIIDDWDDDAQSFPRQEPWRGLVRHGSYMVLAWLHQDVARFNQFLRENAMRVAAPGMSQQDAEELLAAKMMGRWRDGTPLVLSPDKADAPLAKQDFDYSADMDGGRCPVAAHIRIVNGRDQPLDFKNKMMFPSGFPRVLRRGSAYGPWLDGEVDDQQDRGILGIFFCANVNQQFYSLMRWIGKTDFSDAYTDPHGQDPLFASRQVPDATIDFTMQTASGPVTLKGLSNFIRIQGVAILLMPTLETLRRLAT